MKTFRITGSMSGYTPLNKTIQAENKREALIKAVEEWNELNAIEYEEEEVPTIDEQINFWGITASIVK